MAGWLVTSSMSRLLPLLFFLTTIVFVAADSLLPSAPSSSFPQCGLSCRLLTEAAGSCLASPENIHSVHVSCFCQSALISQLHNSPDGSCDDTCTQESDRILLMTWYNNYCSSGGTTDQTDATASSSNTKVQSDSSPPKTWWEGHYQWVIMVIVLIVGFSIVAAVGVWLKKRHDAKHPNLYHGVGGSGSGTDSGLFSSRPRDQSPGPSLPGQLSTTKVGLAPPSRFSYGNNESIASSSRTEVAPSKGRSAASSRLQKTPESTDDRGVEVWEVPR